MNWEHEISKAGYCTSPGYNSKYWCFPNWAVQNAPPVKGCVFFITILTFLACFRLVFVFFFLFFDIRTKRTRARKQTSNGKPAKVRKVACNPMVVSNCWTSGPYTNIPILGPADIKPVAKERRRWKYFAATRNVDVRTQDAPKPNIKPYEKVTWRTVFAKAVMAKLSAHLKPPKMAITRQPKRSDKHAATGEAK